MKRTVPFQQLLMSFVHEEIKGRTLSHYQELAVVYTVMNTPWQKVTNAQVEATPQSLTEKQIVSHSLKNKLGG